MSANGSDVYPPYDRFIDKEAIIEFLNKAKDQDEFKNAAWIEPGVGWGRVAIPIILGIAERKNFFGDKSAYYGFDKEQRHITELKEKLNPDCLQSNHFCCWDITSKDRSAIDACDWKIDRHTPTNVVVVLASFLSHVPNGLHLLRDKLLLPLLRAGKTVSVVLFQCEQNLLTSLIEGAILETDVRSFPINGEKNYYSPLLGRWLDFSAAGTGDSALHYVPTTAETFFKLVDYLYCFKECGNLRRYSMVSPHKVTATDLTPISEFLGYLGFKPLPELSIYGSQDPTNPTKINKAHTWEPKVDNQPLTWKWVRHVFAEWIYKGIMDEGLDTHVKDPVGQLLAFAIMARQAEIADANGLPTDMKILVKMYGSRLGTVNGKNADELKPEKASELRTAVLKWLGSEDSEISADKNGLSNNWKCFLDWLDGNKDHPVIQTMKNRVAPDQSTIDKNRDIVKEALTKYFDLIETEKTSACVCLQKFRTDLRCYRFADSADLPETFDFRHSLIFPSRRLTARDVNRALEKKSHDALHDLLGIFPDLSDFSFPPQLMEVPRRQESEFEFTILQTIARWLACGGLGEWLVMGYFNSRQFEATRDSGEWKIGSGTLFPFTSITANNARILSLATKDKTKFSSIFFDDKLSSDPEITPSRILIFRNTTVATTFPSASLKPDLLGELLSIEVPEIQRRAVEIDADHQMALQNDWKYFKNSLKDEESKIFQHLDDKTGPEFLNALYRLQEYEDCWGKCWEYCYYYLDRRIMRNGELQSQFFSGLAIYSKRKLTMEEEIWCQALSTLLVSEVSAPLLALQALDGKTRATENFLEQAKFVVPKLQELVGFLEKAHVSSNSIARQIEPWRASLYLALGETCAWNAFPEREMTLYYGDESGCLHKNPSDRNYRKLETRHDLQESSDYVHIWTEYRKYFSYLGICSGTRFLTALPEKPPSNNALNNLYNWYESAHSLLKILFRKSWTEPRVLFDPQILVVLRLALPSQINILWTANGHNFLFKAEDIPSMDNSMVGNILPQFAEFISDASGVNRDVYARLLCCEARSILKICDRSALSVLDGLSRLCTNLKGSQKSTSNNESSQKASINKVQVQIDYKFFKLDLSLDPALDENTLNALNNPEQNKSIGGFCSGWLDVRNSVEGSGNATLTPNSITIQWNRVPYIKYNQ